MMEKYRKQIIKLISYAYPIVIVPIALVLWVCAIIVFTLDFAFRGRV